MVSHEGSGRDVSETTEVNVRRLVLAIGLVALFGQACACECRSAPVSSGMESADQVFGAEVVSAKVAGYRVVVEVRGVSRVKGAGKELKRLWTNYGRSACGFTVSVPKKYVFFTRGDGYFDACGATRDFDDPELRDIKNRIFSIQMSK